MRSYRGDLTAVTAILVGTLGSVALYRGLVPTRMEIRTPVVSQDGFTLVGPAKAPTASRPASTILRFRVVKPAGEVFLAGPEGDRLVTAGSELALRNGHFQGRFRTHNGLRPIHMEVEVIQGGRVTSSGNVTSIRPRIAVNGRSITIFGM